MIDFVIATGADSLTFLRANELTIYVLSFIV